MPKLQHVADLTVLVGDPLFIGETPGGVRRVIPILGGKVNGPGLRGIVLPGGADFQLLRQDGVTELHARYTLQCEDNVLIDVDNRGMRHGKDKWLTSHIIVCDGIRHPDNVELAIK